MQFMIEINDAVVYGVTAARLDYNASIPQTIIQGAGEAAVEGPNPALFATDTAYIVARVTGMVQSWADQHRAAAPPPAPAPPAAINGVPQQVTRRQARQALRLCGLLDLVQPAIDAIPEPLQRGLMQDEWDDSLSFERQRPSLIAMAHAIGLTTDAQIDDLFVFAGSLV